MVPTKDSRRKTKDANKAVKKESIEDSLGDLVNIKEEKHRKSRIDSEKKEKSEKRKRKNSEDIIVKEEPDVKEIKPKVNRKSKVKLEKIVDDRTETGQDEAKTADELIDDLIEIQRETDKRNKELSNQIDKRTRDLLPKTLVKYIEKQNAIASFIHKKLEAEKELKQNTKVTKEDMKVERKIDKSSSSKSPKPSRKKQPNIRDEREEEEEDEYNGNDLSKNKTLNNKTRTKSTDSSKESKNNDDDNQDKGEKQISLSKLITEKHPVPTLEEALGTKEMAYFYRKALKEADVFKDKAKSSNGEGNDANDDNDDSITKYKSHFPDTVHTLTELKKYFKEIDPSFTSAMSEAKKGNWGVSTTSKSDKTRENIEKKSDTKKSVNKFSKYTSDLDITESETESDTITNAKLNKNKTIKAVKKTKEGKKELSSTDNISEDSYGDDSGSISTDCSEDESYNPSSQSYDDEREEKDKIRVYRDIQRDEKAMQKKNIKQNTTVKTNSKKITQINDNNSEKKVKLCWKSTFRHNGISFPEPYKPHGVPMLYNKKPIHLKPQCEELATYIAKDLHLSHVHNKTYTTNFFKEFVNRLTKTKDPAAKIIKDFKLCDFTPIKEYLDRQSEFIKHDKDLAKAKKQYNEHLVEFYGYGEVDGFPVRLNPVQVEPPGTFKGRGKHPNAGTIKPTITSEDVTLNLDPLAPIPIPPEGHKWKKLVCNREVIWSASYPGAKKTVKYVRPDDTSFIKSISDFKKFNKSRLLGKYIDKIRQTYIELVKSDDIKDKELGVIIYILDTLAIRGGNKKNTKNSADTVGACTLRKEHIKFLDGGRELDKSNPAGNTIVEFDFLGKDSVRFHKRVVFLPEVYDAIKYIYYHIKYDTANPSNPKSPKAKTQMNLSLSELKKPLFGEVDLSYVNASLGGYMPGLTAKVFRTYNASKKLDELLHSERYNQSVSVSGAIIWRQRFIDANREVAILCNHQTGGTSAVDQDVSNKKDEGFNRRMAAYTDVLLDYTVRLLIERRRNFKLLCALYDKYEETRKASSGSMDIEDIDKFSSFFVLKDLDKDKKREKRSSLPAKASLFSDKDIEKMEGLVDKNNDQELKYIEKLNEIKETKKTVSIQRKAEREEAEMLVRRTKELKANGDKRTEIEIAESLRKQAKLEAKVKTEDEEMMKTSQDPDNPKSTNVKTLEEYKDLTIKNIHSQIIRSFNAIYRIKNTIDMKMSTFNEAVGNKNVSLTTSRQNYIDPRIVVAYCKEHKVPITRIYSPRLLIKFPWALETEDGWRY